MNFLLYIFTNRFQFSLKSLPSLKREIAKAGSFLIRLSFFALQQKCRPIQPDGSAFSATHTHLHSCLLVELLVSVVIILRAKLSGQPLFDAAAPHTEVMPAADQQADNRCKCQAGTDDFQNHTRCFVHIVPPVRHIGVSVVDCSIIHPPRPFDNCFSNELYKFWRFLLRPSAVSPKSVL